MKIFRVAAFLIAISFSVSGQVSQADQAVATQKLVLEAVELLNAGTAESKKAAIVKLEEAARILRKETDRSALAYTLLALANAHNLNGDPQKALAVLSEAMPVIESGNEGEALLSAYMLRAMIYEELKESQKAIDTFQLILARLKDAGSPPETIAATLLKLGSFYSSIQRHDKAIEHYEQTLPLFQKLSNIKAELAVRKAIADAYEELGENEKALAGYHDVLVRNRTAAQKIDEAAIYNGLGLIYENLGEFRAAQTNYEIALTMAKDDRSRGYLLANVGRVSINYDRLKAAKNLSEALTLLRAAGERLAEAATLHNIGAVYSVSDEDDKALAAYERAFDIRQAEGDERGQALTLNAIGGIHVDAGDSKKALPLFLKSFALIRNVKDPHGEAMILGNISGIFSESNPRLAILFAKEALNKHQRLRRNIRGLEPEIQKSYLRRSQLMYRWLIELLVSENRLSEAVQVIDFFRDQGFMDIVRGSERSSRTVSFSQREASFLAALESATEKASKAIDGIADARRRLGPAPSTAGTAELEKSKVALEADYAELARLVQAAEVEFRQPVTKSDVAQDVPDLLNLQNALKLLQQQTGEKIALVYVVLAKSRVTELLISADRVTPIFVKVSGEELDKKAKEFVENLKTLDSSNRPAIDVTDQAKELYNLVFKPLEPILPAATTTILWSLDSRLRYVPIGALHDGTDFLIKRKLNNVIFTRSDPERLTRPLQTVWRGTGLATSEAKSNVKNLSVSHSFPALVGVDSEMDGVFRAVGSEAPLVSGSVLANSGFTRSAMLTALANKNPLVHISSHFVLKPGDLSRSFLLLGDGNAFSLAEMRKEERLFEGVDLLTLSACDTGVDEPDSEGREVDGFAELAQRLGAASVLATLWSVNECSTAEFMKLFYRNKIRGGMTKAEAMRQAQASLLSGSAKVPEGKCRSRKAGDNPPPAGPKSSKVFKAYRTDPAKPYEHPYYWSSFVLYGNWK